MTTHTFPPDVLEQAQAINEGWKGIDPTLKAGTLTQTAFADKLTDRQTLSSQLSALEAQLTDLRNQRDAADSDIWEDIKRVRSVVKGTYGDDSSQYDVIGQHAQERAQTPKAQA